MPLTISKQAGWDHGGETVVIELGFPEEISEDQWLRLKRLIEAWFTLGSYGGYGGYLHGPLLLSPPARLDSVEAESVWGAHISFDASGVADIDVPLAYLARSLEGFAVIDQVIVQRLVLLSLF